MGDGPSSFGRLFDCPLLGACFFGRYSTEIENSPLLSGLYLGNYLSWETGRARAEVPQGSPSIDATDIWGPTLGRQSHFGLEPIFAMSRDHLVLIKSRKRTIQMLR